MSHRFREVRKGERDAVIAFAKQHGCAIEPKRLHHHLSLALERGDAMVAVSLCVEQANNQFVVEIVAGEPALDEALVKELADRCLRKVQAENIAAARLQSPAQEPAEVICTRANWLDTIGETAPPNTEPATEDLPQDAPQAA